MLLFLVVNLIQQSPGFFRMGQPPCMV